MNTLRYALMLSLMLGWASAAAAQSTFTVTTTNDSGAGSLRQAIADANASPGLDQIHFAIAGAGPHVIAPFSALPQVTEGVTIDGFTQPGAQPNTNPITEPVSATLQIVLDGVNTGAFVVGLNLGGGGSTVRGLNIQRFGDDGIQINSPGNTIVGNYIGTDVTGMSDRGNGFAGVRIFFSADNTFGGTDPADRNVISGNTGSGLSFFGAGTTGNVVVGNVIGLNAAGTAPVPNGFEGVIFDEAANNRVGGPTLAERNIISGNTLDGVNHFKETAVGNVVQGNYIGTDRTGTAGIGNQRNGVRADSSPGGTIGGPTGTPGTGAGNLIAHNAQHGIALYNAAHDWTIQGNLVGTNASGTAAIGNGSHGMQVQTESNTVGGTDAQARNVISGNASDGIQMDGGDENVVLGNYIGTDITGTTALGNGGDGVDLEGGDDNTIGGAGAGARNVISGNLARGVRIREAGDRNTVLGNYIGVAADGATALGNGLDGIIIEGGDDNMIGGTAGNVIAHNSGGVVVNDGSGNAILGNRIFDNDNLGIDLLDDGPTSNDGGDADDGPNRLQNTPEIASATSAGGTLTVRYSVASEVAHSAYPLVVEFFLADALGEEGAAFLGADTYEAAEAQTTVTASFAPAEPVQNGDRIVATATDADGNTSEFSAMAFGVPNEPSTALPVAFALHGAYPNPFNPATTLRYDVPKAGPVHIAVYDALGRKAAVLMDRPVPAGTHAVVFEARGLPSGPYLVQMTTPDGLTQTRRVTLLR